MKNTSLMMPKLPHHRTRPIPREPRDKAVIREVVEQHNGREFRREVLVPKHFITVDGMIDLTSIKCVLAPWIREQIKNALRDANASE